MKFKIQSFFLLLLILTLFMQAGQFSLTFDRYHSPAEINNLLKQLANAHPKITTLHKIAESPGGTPLMVLEIGSESVDKNKKNPSIMILANMSGIIPLSTEAAMMAIQMILEKNEIYKKTNWYILPVGNPDAAKRFFSKPLIMESRNSSPYNDDKDDKTDEDPPEDLNGDGIISMMRVKHSQGQWLPVPGEPRLMKKADWTKGEKGIYKEYTEGIDNDGDGKFNEDGIGGVDISVNFPHLFNFFTKNGGLWAGSEAESYNLIKFIFDHKEIAMTIVFGESNFCLIPPRGGRKGTTDFSKIKIPERIGKRLNIDFSRTYSMKEIMEIVQRIVPSGFEITESMVASFLGLGATVNPLPSDLKFYNHLSEQYKDFLKKRKLSQDRIDPSKAKDGSFELWAYYHLGLPSFSMDFWTLPKVKDDKKKSAAITPEKLEKMSNEEFLALGEEKIAEFLKSSGAPANIKPQMIINAMKNGMMTTKRMATMMKNMPKPKSKEGADPVLKALLAFSDKELKGNGFVKWKSFRHPLFGEVEIGGVVPFALNTPPAHMIKSLLEGQVPWIFQLADKLARIKIGKNTIKSLGDGLYRLTVWIENQGYLPYPTEMGKKNGRIPPIVVKLRGNDVRFIEGKARSVIKSIPGNQSVKLNWVLYCPKPGKLAIKAESPLAWTDRALINLGGVK